MKLQNYFIVLVIVSFLVSCKSKQKTVAKNYPKKEYSKKIDKKEDKKEIEVSKEVKSVIFKSTEDYVAHFKGAAIDEMKIYKIPASITLAQGILESSSGSSELTKRSNNHFGIKCHKEWTGPHTLHDDDELAECFRVYEDPNGSYRDHSLFLTTRSRYSKLFELEPGDYVGWAEGLSAAGYATDRRYPAKLIGLIEKFELHKYDAEVLGRSYQVKKFVAKEEHMVTKGDTLYNISKRYGLTVDELKKLNGLRSNDISIGQSLITKK